MNLPIGLYDQIITESLSAQINPIHADIQPLKDSSVDLLADTITRQLVSILEDLPGDESDKAEKQLELVNALLVQIRKILSSESDGNDATSILDLVSSPLRRLRAIHHDRQFPTPPEIGLAVPWLFTAGKGSPSLLQEIRRELSSADQVDILVSFADRAER